jgi:glycosyltransferase involved in cell wall biosynthesis
MPVRDEASHLAAAISSVETQRLPRGWHSELIVALAPSKDATAALLTELANSLPAGWLKILANPTGDTASGLNLALAEAAGEIVVRVDGHSRLPEDYVAQGIAVLSEDSKIGNVGGMMIAIGENPLQRAIAWAYGSRFGLGGGKFHVGGDAGSVDTVYLGTFRTTALRQVGGFDAKFVRGQDWELNQRLRDAGYLVWFEPRLRVEYRPRNSLVALREQFFDTGLWRGVLTRQRRGQAQLRYFAPPVLVILSIFVLPALAYLLAIGAISLLVKLDWASRFRLLLVLPTMHYSWGLGFLRGAIFGAASKPS